MDFKTCIQDAIETGRVSTKKGDEAKAAFDKAYADGIAAGLIDDVARDQAAMKALENTTRLKYEKRWERLNVMRVAYELNKEIMSSADPGYALVTIAARLDQRYVQRVGQAMAIVGSDLQLKYKPQKGGLVHPTEGQEFLLRAMFDESVPPEFRAYAANIREAYKMLIDSANARGAAIPFDENWHLPQTIDRLKVRQSSRLDYDTAKTEFVKFYTTDGILDWEKMRYAGKPIDVADRETIMARVFDNINDADTTKGKAAQHGAQGLAARMSRERFFHYANSDAWLKGMKKYGAGTVFEQIIGSVDHLSRELATLEVLGPNPASMKEFTINSANIRADELNKLTGKGDKSWTAKIREATATFKGMYDLHTLSVPTGEESALAQSGATMRTVTLATVLGKVWYASLMDLAQSKYSGMMLKHPMSNMMFDYAKGMLDTKANFRAGVAQGVIMENALAMAHSRIRYFGAMDGAHWARRYADVVYRTSLLSPHTQVIRTNAALNVHSIWAQYANKAFDDLPFAEDFIKFGITAKDWDTFRSAGVTNIDGADFLVPGEARKTLTKYSEQRSIDKFGDFVSWFMDMASPNADLRSRVFLGQHTDPTAVLGQNSRMWGMLKGFPTFIMFNHLGYIMRNSSGLDRVTRVAKFAAFMTVAGMFITQIKALTSGSYYDPREMTGKGWADFLLRSFMNGGSGGLLGDVVMNNVDIVNGRVLNSDGPLLRLVNRAAKRVWDAGEDIAGGEFLNATKNTGLLVTDMIPNILGIKLLLDRAFLDAMLEEVDPEAYQRKIRYEQKQAEDLGLSRWSSTGE